MRSSAASLPEIIMEMQASRTSEREGPTDRQRSASARWKRRSRKGISDMTLADSLTADTDLDLWLATSRPKSHCCASSPAAALMMASRP
jgi:hypothetical protein